MPELTHELLIGNALLSRWPNRGRGGGGAILLFRTLSSVTSQCTTSPFDLWAMGLGMGREGVPISVATRCTSSL